MTLLRLVDLLLVAATVFAVLGAFLVYPPASLIVAASACCVFWWLFDDRDIS